MHRAIALVICGLVCAGLVHVEAPPEAKKSTFLDREYGFTIDTPRFEPVKPDATMVRVGFFAPPENHFSSNVNVMIQEATFSRTDYRKLSLKQYETMGYKVNAEENRTVNGKDALLLDAEGEQQGRQMRFLSLAVFDTKRVLLITCTAPKESFAQYEAVFRACVNSFRLAH